MGIPASFLLVLEVPGKSLLTVLRSSGRLWEVSFNSSEVLWEALGGVFQEQEEETQRGDDSSS